MSKRHTLESIAKIAGVSRSTVSRVLNRQQYVRPKVRERVLEVIRKERYYPNAMARSLVSNRSNAVGIVVFGLDPLFLSNQLFFEIIQGIQRKALECDIDLMLYSPENEEKEYCHKIVGRGNVDGLIVMGELIHVDYLRIFHRAGLPMVLIGKRDVGELEIPHVCTNYVVGAEEAVRHLIGTGRRSIAMMQCFREPLHEREKLEGYKKALGENGVSFNPALVLEGLAVQERAQEEIRKMLEAGERIDGLFAANDLMAQGAIQELQRLGLRVPEDVSVIGFDDIITARTFNPPLTTVRQDKLRLGGEALEVLTEVLTYRKADSRVLPPELVVRETTCPAKR